MQQTQVLVPARWERCQVSMRMLIALFAGICVFNLVMAYKIWKGDYDPK